MWVSTPNDSTKSSARSAAIAHPSVLKVGQYSWCSHPVFSIKRLGKAGTGRCDQALPLWKAEDQARSRGKVIFASVDNAAIRNTPDCKSPPAATTSANNRPPLNLYDC